MRTPPLPLPRDWPKDWKEPVATIQGWEASHREYPAKMIVRHDGTGWQRGGVPWTVSSHLLALHAAGKA